MFVTQDQEGSCKPEAIAQVLKAEVVDRFGALNLDSLVVAIACRYSFVHEVGLSAAEVMSKAVRN
jgi:hypothetical protein